MPLSRQIARQLSGPVGRLESLLVPLVAGGRDSHGQAIADEDALLASLRQVLGEARDAIELAHQELAHVGQS